MDLTKGSDSPRCGREGLWEDHTAAPTTIPQLRALNLRMQTLTIMLLPPVCVLNVYASALPPHIAHVSQIRPASSFGSVRHGSFFARSPKLSKPREHATSNGLDCYRYGTTWSQELGHCHAASMPRSDPPILVPALPCRPVPLALPIGWCPRTHHFSPYTTPLNRSDEEVVGTTLSATLSTPPCSIAHQTTSVSQ